MEDKESTTKETDILLTLQHANFQEIAQDFIERQDTGAVCDIIAATIGRALNKNGIKVYAATAILPIREGIVVSPDERAQGLIILGGKGQRLKIFDPLYLYYIDLIENRFSMAYKPTIQVFDGLKIPIIGSGNRPMYDVLV